MINHDNDNRLFEMSYFLFFNRQPGYWISIFSRPGWPGGSIPMPWLQQSIKMHTHTDTCTHTFFISFIGLINLRIAINIHLIKHNKLSKLVKISHKNWTCLHYIHFRMRRGSSYKQPTYCRSSNIDCNNYFKIFNCIIEHGTWKQALKACYA